jgi:hypothetical protein
MSSNRAISRRSVHGAKNAVVKILSETCSQRFALKQPEGAGAAFLPFGA